MTQAARELLEHGLKDMYDAEQRFERALDEMARNATDRFLADNFRRHHQVTKGHVKRLEGAFAAMGERPMTTTCPGARGLIQEYETFFAANRGKAKLLDAFAAAAGLKAEHYEIASYRTLVDLAEYCGEDGVARYLKQNLAEEEQAAAEMMSAASMLSANLADAPVRAVAGRAAGAMFDRMREGTFASIGGAKAITGRAAARAQSAASARKTTRKRATTASKRRKTTARAKTTRSRTTTGRRKTTARRKTTTARGRTTTKPRARKTTRRTTKPKAKARTRSRSR